MLVDHLVHYVVRKAERLERLNVLAQRRPLMLIEIILLDSHHLCINVDAHAILAHLEHKPQTTRPGVLVDDNLSYVHRLFWLRSDQQIHTLEIGWIHPLLVFKLAPSLEPCVLFRIHNSS